MIKFNVRSFFTEYQGQQARERPFPRDGYKIARQLTMQVCLIEKVCVRKMKLFLEIEVQSRNKRNGKDILC